MIDHTCILSRRPFDLPYDYPITNIIYKKTANNLFNVV